MSQVAGMMRSRLWNQSVAGATLAGCFAPSSIIGGYGGIPQILQQYLPPNQPINWRGAYSATAYYNQDDGVTEAVAMTTNCTWTTTNGNITTTGSFTTSNIVAGMMVAGAGIPPETYVLSVTSATALVLSNTPTAGGAAATLTFTGWYRAFQTTHAVAPAGVGNLVNWNLVPAGHPSYFGGPYNSQSVLPVMMFGNNDIKQSAMRNPQPFLSALQAAFARISAAYVWGNNSPLVTLAGGTFTALTYATLTIPFGSGTQLVLVPNTAGATMSAMTPPDWPGGYVDFGFCLSYAASSSTPATGTLDFTVDGSAVNCICSGMANGSAVNFASPLRQAYASCALATALTSGVSSGSTLTIQGSDFAIGSGSSVVVGGVNGGPSMTFVTTASAVAGATSLAVTAQTPTSTFPVGTPVYDSTYADAGWLSANDVVVRVPVPAGSHYVTATVPTSPSIANLYFDYISLEAKTQPIGLMFGLWKVINLLGMGGSLPTFQDIDVWNADIQTVIGAGNEWPHVFVDISNVFLNTSPLSTALTLGQTGITSLSLSSGLVVNIAAGDTVQIGSGATFQRVIASASAAIGATTVNVNSFTSTYAQPTGTPIFDFTVACQYFYQDGIHPNPTGHALISSVVWQNLLSSLPNTIPQLAVMSEEAGRPTALVNLATGTDLVIGSATTAGAWASVAGLYATVPAEPGDILEISVNGLYDALAAVGSLDIVTFNLPAYIAGNSAGVASVINYLSGAAGVGGPLTGIGLGYAAVGAQATDGLSALYSPGASTTIPEAITGTFHYPVQPADIIDGSVAIGMVGRSSTTSVRHIKNAAGYQFIMSVVNVGPLSYASEA